MAEVDVDQARPLLHELGLGEPVAVHEMKGGTSPVFRIDLARGNALVLKTYPRAEILPAREVYAAGLVAHLDIPMTRYLAVDQTGTRLPFAFALTNYLPGVPVLSFRDEPDVADLYRQMGALLRTLHTVRMPAFGHFDERGIATPVSTNAEYMRVIAAHAFPQFRHYGGDEVLAERLEQIVKSRSGLFECSRGPVFAHNDLHPNNVLALRDDQGQLRVSGLIDFGNARSSDAVFDLAKTLFCCEHDAPGSTGPIKEGYGAIDHPDPAGALWLSMLLHRVTMWCWLRHVGTIADGQPSELIDDLRAMAEGSK